MKYNASSLPVSLLVHSPGECKNMGAKGEEKEGGREGRSQGESQGVREEWKEGGRDPERKWEGRERRERVLGAAGPERHWRRSCSFFPWRKGNGEGGKEREKGRRGGQ